MFYKFSFKMHFVTYIIGTLFFGFCPVLSQSSSEEHELIGSPNDFVITRIAPDGEQETRLMYNGITAVETTVSAPGHMHYGMSLKQLSDGQKLIHLIYTGDDELQDCEITKDIQDIDNFLQQFKVDVEEIEKLQHLSEVDEEMHSYPIETTTNRNLTEPFQYRNVSIQFLDKENVGPEILALTNMHNMKQECRKLQKKLRKSVSHRHHGREKRNVLIYPGTYWCGNGDAAKNFNDLGENAGADRCCRQHDHCPYIIEGFSSKYNIFNYRFHTLSHCECDESFKTCLKMSNTGTANMVGKIYFNLIQPRCFTLHLEKMCARRSWWGKCIKYDIVHTAKLHDPITY